jgi:hypothetical protein
MLVGFVLQLLLKAVAHPLLAFGQHRRLDFP